MCIGKQVKIGFLAAGFRFQTENGSRGFNFWLKKKDSG